jgi:hypothetical protein
MRIALLLLAALTASQAFATRARMRAMNQDTNGSYYLMDTRNIFLNPAHINLIKDHANFEWGQKQRTGVTDEIPEAEGGFVTTAFNGRLGVHLGRVSDFNQNVRAINAILPDLVSSVMATNKIQEGQNNIDIIYGRTASNPWGVGLAISRSKTATGTPEKQTSVQAFDFKGGYSTDTMHLFGSLLLGAKSETDFGGSTGELDEKYGVKAGGAYNLNSERKVYGSLRYDVMDATRGTTVEYDIKAWDLLAGIVQSRNLDNNARVFIAGELTYLNVVGHNGKGVPDEVYKELMLPVTMGVEADGNSWLRLRASVKQNFLISDVKTTTGATANDDNRYNNSPNDTAVAAGAGASLNKFNFDIALVQSLNDDHGRGEFSLTYLF